MTPRCSTVGEHDPSFLTVGQATKLALPWGSPLGPVHMREASLTRDPGLEFWGGYPRAPPGLLSPGLPGLELHVLFPNLASTNQESNLERMQDNKHPFCGGYPGLLRDLLLLPLQLTVIFLRSDQLALEHTAFPLPQPLKY